MGRRSGFSVNLLLAKKEQRVAAEAKGEPARENLLQLSQQVQWMMEVKMS